MKMKILIIGLDLNPPWVEGIRNTVRNISKEFLRKNDEVIVLTKGSSDQPRIEYIEGVKFYRILTGNKNSGDDYLSGLLKFLLTLPFELHHIIREEKIEIVHGHSVFPIFGLYFGIFTRFFRTKTIFSLYSSHLTRNKKTEYPAVMKVLDLSKSKYIILLLSYFVQKIIVTSEKTQQALYGIGVALNKVTYVPVGVNTILFSCKENNEAKQSYIYPDGKKIILFAGDITPWKGLDVFLRSIKSISKQHPDIIGLVLTKEIYRYENERRNEVLKYIKESNIEPFIKIIGKQEDISEIYNIADIIVFPFISLFSVMDIPLSILEAMACEKPVIATDVGSISELINNSNGLLIEPDNVQQLNIAIITLLQDTQLCSLLAKNAREIIINRYDIRKVSNDIRNMYSSMLHGERNGEINSH
jgi:glycosyltransferase involved in cell wall biosynthesis